MMLLHAAARLGDGRLLLDRQAIEQESQRLANLLRESGSRVMATLLDNGPEWVIADLAAAQAGVVHVPLPVFFTPAQIGHALQAAGVDTVLAAPDAAGALPPLPQDALEVAGATVLRVRLPAPAVPMPQGTAKITFTSGTTGQPKGVCLTAPAMDAVAQGLVTALSPLGIHRHLCALPLAVLLENIAGVMAPLRHGATCVVPPLGEVGLTGSSGFDPAVLHRAVVRHQPNSLILLPQMLRAWTMWLNFQGQRAPACLRIVAVGGASVGKALVQAAQAVGIPACEGYGLSEGASVQTLNLPGAARPGSAGKPLPHTHLRVSPQGEIEVAGSLFAGYLGSDAPVPQWWPTGDLGHVDEDGFVHVRGRSRNVLITAFGRNVSPEWVEGALREHSVIGQAVVLGEAQPALSAVLWPAVPAITDAQLAQAVAAANASLPDYARVHRWVRGQAPFDAASGMATANGRPQRAAVQALHAAALDLPELQTA